MKGKNVLWAREEKKSRRNPIFNKNSHKEEKFVLPDGKVLSALNGLKPVPQSVKFLFTTNISRI